jgi:hypothetical protein
MKTKKLFIGLIFLCQCFNLLHAEDIYISSSEELTNACINASSGDVIFIAAGTYIGPFVINTKSDVTLTGYNGEAIIEGTGSMVLIEIYNSSNITINNLIFRNNIGNDSEGIKIHGTGDGFNITNCEFYNIGWTSTKATMPTSSNSAHAIVLVGSESTSLKNIFIGGNYIHDCITGYSESVTLVGNVEYFLIEGNTLENNTNIGIVAAGNYTWTGAPDNLNIARSGIIRKNVVSNYAGPEDLDAAGGIYVDGGNYITVENNIIFNYKVGISIGCENPDRNVYGNIVRNNLAYNCGFSGLFVGSNTTSMVNNTQVSNNTFYKCGTGKYDIGQIALLNNSGTIIKNNILYPENWRYAIVQLDATASTELSEIYNLYWRDNGNTEYLYYNVSEGSNTILADPLFINVEENNYRISEYSPAMDAGDPNFDGSGQEDLDGNSRVQNNRVDLGAYEVFAIAIDGLAQDWAELSVIDTNDGIALKTFSTKSSIYLAAIGELNNSYQVFIDSDNDASTGFVDYGWLTSGADYMIENGNLYSYAGDGWSWTLVDAITAYHNEDLTELEIPLSYLNSLSGTVNFGYKDMNDWTVEAVVPASGSSLVSCLLSTDLKTSFENSVEIQSIIELPYINIYPNPVNDVLNITSNTVFKEVQVFDLSGQEIMSNQTHSDCQSLSLNDLKPGYYLCRIWFDDNTFITREVVVKK